MAGLWVKPLLHNPQIQVGPDILMRIHYADEPGGLKEINRLIIDGLNREIKALSACSGLQPTDIYVAALAGNDGHDPSVYGP